MASETPQLRDSPRDCPRARRGRRTGCQDGAWVAYSSGIRPSAVYVRPFPLTGAVYQVSKNDDGHHPWWSYDGRELLYVPGPDGLVRVTVNRSPSVWFSAPSALPPRPS